MLAILYCGVLGLLFIQTGHSMEACISFSLLGATIGLLYYNYSPAKIYMGDTGSMLSGFTIFILSAFYVRFMSTAPIAVNAGSAFMMALAILFYPVFDALRVFILRTKNGISPLKADRRHLHYYLLDSGMSHAATAWLITGVNVVTIALAVLLRNKMHFGFMLLIISLPSIVLAVAAQQMQRGKMNS